MFKPRCKFCNSRQMTFEQKNPISKKHKYTCRDCGKDSKFYYSELKEME